jgi:hypothetical protein
MYSSSQVLSLNLRVKNSSGEQQYKSELHQRPTSATYIDFYLPGPLNWRNSTSLTPEKKTTMASLFRWTLNFLFEPDHISLFILFHFIWFATFVYLMATSVSYLSPRYQPIRPTRKPQYILLRSALYTSLSTIVFIEMCWLFGMFWHGARLMYSVDLDSAWLKFYTTLTTVCTVAFTPVFIFFYLSCIIIMVRKLILLWSWKEAVVVDVFGQKKGGENNI